MRSTHDADAVGDGDYDHREQLEDKYDRERRVPVDARLPEAMEVVALAWQKHLSS